MAAITTSTMMAMTMAAFISGNVPLARHIDTLPRDDSVVTEDLLPAQRGRGSATWSALITCGPIGSGAQPWSWPQTKSKAGWAAP